MPTIQWGAGSAPLPEVSPLADPEGRVKCCKCGELKPPAEFDQYRKRAGGKVYRGTCRLCRRKYQNGRYSFRERRRKYADELRAGGRPAPAYSGPRKKRGPR